MEEQERPREIPWQRCRPSWSARSAAKWKISGVSRMRLAATVVAAALEVIKLHGALGRPIKP